MTKTYVRDLERFGGKAAVLFDDFNRWFAALWQGKALGATIAWLSVLAAGLIYAIASHIRRQNHQLDLSMAMRELPPE